MIYIILFQFIVILGLIFLFYKKNDFFEKNGYLYLKLRKKPKVVQFEDIDSLTTLRDTIECAKLENWNVVIEDDILQRTFSLTIINHNSSVMITCRIRIMSPSDYPYIAGLYIKGSEGSIPFDNLSKTSNVEEYKLVVEYMWSLIVDRFDNKNLEIKSHFEKSNATVKKSLLMLNRNRKLENIFGD